MKKLIIITLVLLLAASLFGCASLEYQEGGSGHEMHPGHVGHEMHGY